MKIEIKIEEFEELTWDDEWCHLIKEPFTHSLCGIRRSPNDKIVERSDKPDCPICTAIYKYD